MTLVQIDLPPDAAEEARAAGLLTPRALGQMLLDALARRRAADSLLAVAGRAADAGIAAMAMQEIVAEVKAARAERRGHASGS